MKYFFLFCCLLNLAIGYCVPAHADAASPSSIVVERKGWSFDNSMLEWYPWAKPDEQKQKGTLGGLAGWAEYRFDIPASGWYELWENTVPGWSRDVFLDGHLLFRLTTSSKEDVVNGVLKEANLYLTAGPHTLRFRRLGFPGVLPSMWELKSSDNDPAGSVRAQIVGSNVIRADQIVDFQFTGGCGVPTHYDLVSRDTDTGDLTDVGSVSFDASEAPVIKDVNLIFPKQGVYELIGRVDGKLLRPADFKAPLITVIDAKPVPPAASLQRKLVADIDCVKQPPLAEKDGPSAIAHSAAGWYRESSGKGSNEYWATDGFSYAFDLPDDNGPYQLEVDYPDDDRRTMGFWINDQSDPQTPSIPLTGGVDTGDRYRTSDKMLTYVATFWPRGTHIVFAAVNLNPGMKVAAARIRVYKIEGDFDAGPKGRSDGRRLGYYYEESSRWLLHFGAEKEKSEDLNSLLTMERWGQFNRYMGANLMFPTVNVYQDNRFPSKILEGYFNATDDECRMNALFAEKYGNAYIPEIDLSGQSWFDKHVMGVWYDDSAKLLKFMEPQDEPLVLKDKDGNDYVNGHFYYNCLNPDVQDKYIGVFGELADDLKDCASFDGISSRLMLSWAWQGWNALPGLNWGYDDWTVSQFQKDTGIQVPGNAGDPNRFEIRYHFLTGPQRKAWISWRCQKVFDYHSRLLARIRKAKPSAKLYFTFYGQDPREETSSNLLVQMRDIGMDPALYEKEPGIVVVPIVMYGRRYSSPIADANLYNSLFSQGTKSISNDLGKAILDNGSYFEAGHIGWKTFGADNDRYMNDVCMPSGRNELENLAISLADCDCSTLVMGAYGQIYGAPALMREFNAEYMSLPALPFTPLPSGRDPVAVWYRQCPDGFYFYEVNREPYNVETSLKLNVSADPISLSSRLPASLSDHALQLTLLPFQLRSFKIDGKASITGFHADIPSSEKELLARQIAFAKSIGERLRNRTLLPEFSQQQASECENLIDDANSAYEAGNYWKARTNLERPELITVWEMIGAYPPDLQYRLLPRGYVKTVPSPAPKLDFSGIVGDVRGKPAAANALTFDSDGNLWLADSAQLMEFNSQGKYLRSLRLDSAYRLPSGDIRGMNTALPDYLIPDTLLSLSNGNLAALNSQSPVYTYETNTGRLVEMERAPGINLPGRGGQMACDSGGNLYAACSGSDTIEGVYKYRANGDEAYDFVADTAPTNRLCSCASGGVAVDAAGNIYISNRTTKRIDIYSATGRQVDSISIPGINDVGTLAVTPDGQWLFAIANNGGALIGLIRGSNGKYSPRWRPNLRGKISALAISKSGELVVGFSSAVDGNCALGYQVSSNDVKPVSFQIPTQDAIFPAFLSGRTPLRAYNGSIYYFCRNQLVRLTPGSTDTAKVVFDPKLTVWSFAFSQSGDLYLATLNNQKVRGLFLWKAAKDGSGWNAPESLTGEAPINTDTTADRPYDLAVGADNKLILRDIEKKDWPILHIFERSQDGSMHEIMNMGSISTPPWNGFYGLSVDPATDGVSIAGGPSHSIAALNADNSLRWMRTYHIADLPGDLPLCDPEAVAIDHEGRTWGVDSGADKILCFDSKGNYLASYGEFGGMDQQDGFSFCDPSGIAITSDGSREWLYIADTVNQRIVKFTIENPN